LIDDDEEERGMMMAKFGTSTFQFHDEIVDEEHNVFALNVFFLIDFLLCVGSAARPRNKQRY
jgi:hypothetical protein